MEVESDRDKELLWIAKEAMGAALPAGWTQHEDKDGEHPRTQTLRLFSSAPFFLCSLFERILFFLVLG